MQLSIYKKQLFWGIKVWQLLLFFTVYAIFACQYWLAIYFTTSGYSNIWREELIDYFFLKAMLTLPLWWLYFIKFKNKGLAFKIILHLVTGPVWVACWFYSYRFIQDLRGQGYLSADGKWWDVYIPGLVYYLQFSVFHVYDFYLQTQHQKQKEKQQVLAMIAQLEFFPHFSIFKATSISPHNLFLSGPDSKYRHFSFLVGE